MPAHKGYIRATPHGPDRPDDWREQAECKDDPTPDLWFVTYISTPPRALAPFHHRVQFRNAMAATSPAAAPVSVAPADEMMPLTRMEDLPNLDNDVMCDGVECERPADAVLAQTCQCQIRALGCWQCHDHDLELPGVARCGSCGALVTWATAWTIVHVLRPRSAS